jgi:amino acid transporter
MANEAGTAEGLGGDTASKLEAFGYRQELKRSLGLWDLVMFGLLLISPTAPFTVFGIVYNLAHGMVPLVYAIGLAAMIFTALSYMTMAKAFPVAGSVYAYAGRGIGESFGFLAGWSILLDYLLIPTVCYVFAAVAIHAVAPDLPKPALVLAMLVVVTATNLAGIEVAAWFSRLMLWVQIAVLIAFVVLGAQGIQHGTAGARLSVQPFFQPQFVTAPLVFGALSIAVLSFLGFDAISTLSEEAKGGPRSVGLATILCLFAAAGLFILQTWLACLFVLDKPAFAQGDATENAFLNIAALLGGSWFKLACSLFGIALGCVACSQTGQAAASRLIYGMARDRKLPPWLAHVHGRRRTPERAILLIAALTLALGLTLVDQLELLTSLVSFGALTGFLLLHLSVLVHFGRKSGRKLLLHVLSPILGFAVIAYALWNMKPLALIIGLSWLAVGVLALIWLKLTGRKVEAPAEA